MAHPDLEALDRIETAARVKVIYPEASPEQIAAAEEAVMTFFARKGIRPVDAADAVFKLEGEAYLHSDDPADQISDEEDAAIDAWEEAAKVAFRAISGDAPAGGVPEALRLELDIDETAWQAALGDDDSEVE